MGIDVGGNQAMFTSKLKVTAIALWAAAIVTAGAKEPDDIVQTARVRAKAKKNLNTIVLGLQNYADKNKGRMPPPAVIDKNGKRLLSWRVLILPYIEHKDLYEQFHLDEPWDNEHNKKLLAKMPTVFASNPPKGKKPHATYYQALVGSGAAFEEGKQFLFPSDFSDGVSNTIGVIEATTAVPWTKPEDVRYDPDKPLPRFGGPLGGDFHAGFLDGFVRLMSKNADETNLRIVITRAGGEAATFDNILADEVNARDKADKDELARNKERLKDALAKTWKEVNAVKEKLGKVPVKVGADKASAKENAALMELLEKALEELDALQEQITRQMN
jgi:hypothetical protein